MLIARKHEKWRREAAAGRKVPEWIRHMIPDLLRGWVDEWQRRQTLKHWARYGSHIENEIDALARKVLR